MRGEVFRQLRELVEVAEDNGQLFWALNVSAVLYLGGGEKKIPKVDGDIPNSQKYHETSGISSNWMVLFSWPLFPVVALFSSNFLQCSHQTVR
jgi:hypothetical protein